MGIRLLASLFVAAVAAQNTNDGRRAAYSQDQAVFYGLPETAVRDAYNNFNASVDTGVITIDTRYTTDEQGVSRRWDFGLRVSAYVSLNNAEQVEEDNQVTQFTSFSFVQPEEDNDTNYNQGVCFAIVEGLNEELTELAQNEEARGSCDFIPSECRNDLSSLAWDTTTEDSCDSFDLPESCQDVFPEGRINRFYAETGEIQDAEGYLFAHASPPQERASEDASAAYETALRKVWLVYTTSTDGTDDDFGFGSTTCVRARVFEDGSNDPFENDEGSNDDNDDNEGSNEDNNNDEGSNEDNNNDEGSNEDNNNDEGSNEDNNDEGSSADNNDDDADGNESSASITTTSLFCFLVAATLAVLIV